MYIEREINKRFNKISSAYSSVALVGARQSGKTTFLKEQIKSLKSTYLLFDDPDIRSLFEEDIKKFEKQYLENNDLAIFDEVQYCKDAGQKIKYLVDVGKKIWLTSSSEILLNKEVLAYLVGRVSVLRLYPFSLLEFLSAKKQKELTKKILERHVWEHITYGGYPKVVLTEDIEIKKTILKDLYETMILKDIARTFSIEDIKQLENFSKYLALNIGGLISYESIAKDLKLSFQSVKKYLNAMEKSYLVSLVQPFFKNKNKEITKQPKIYFIDSGLRNIIAKEFDINFNGKLFENYVFTELLKLDFAPKYWRTKSKLEIDFIIELNSEITPIEVKITSPENVERNLRTFIETHKTKKAFVIFYKGEEKTIEVGKCKVIFTNIFDFKKYL